MTNQPPAAIIEEWQECRVLNVRPDGALVAIVGGNEQELEIAGIGLPGSPSAAFLNFLGRLSGGRQRVRCRVLGHTLTGRIRAEIRYFGWQDKSGEVWLDLAATLIEQGFARPVAGEPTP